MKLLNLNICIKLDNIKEVKDFLANVENEWKKEQPKFLEFAIIYNDIHIGA